MAARTHPEAPVVTGRLAWSAFMGAFLLYVVLAVLLTAQAWQAPTTRWIGGCCDQEQAMWFLRWIPTSIGRGIDPFVTTQINAPAGVNLMWNTLMAPIGLALAPITVVAGPVFAYNVGIVGAIALSGLACFAALHRYANGIAGPLAGGAVYAFSPYVASHAALHLNLVSVWAPPLVLIVLDEMLVRRRRNPVTLGAALGVLAGIQLLTSEEILATGAVAAAVFAGVLAIVTRDRGAHHRGSQARRPRLPPGTGRPHSRRRVATGRAVPRAAAGHRPCPGHGHVLDGPAQPRGADGVPAVRPGGRDPHLA